jgi:hypothetical protein
MCKVPSVACRLRDLVDQENGPQKELAAGYMRSSRSPQHRNKNVTLICALLVTSCVGWFRVADLLSVLRSGAKCCPPVELWLSALHE